MFRRILVFLAAPVALMACGDPASESLPTLAQSKPTPASQIDDTMPPQVASAPPASLPRQDAASAATPIAPLSESDRCLDLVSDGAFTEAVPVCVRATGLDPENTAVKQALETARAKAATAALGGSSAIPVAREDMPGGVAVDARLP